MKLTRSPGLSYLWMGIAICIVAVLFTRWQWFINRGQQRLWWELVLVFLAADYLFLITPIQDHKSIRRLSIAGKLWAAIAWMCCIAYLVVITRGIKPVLANSSLIIQLSLLGLLLLVVLVISVYRLSHEWIRESLRSIMACAGGGFLVRFVTAPTGDSEVLAGLQAPSRKIQEDCGEGDNPGRNPPDPQANGYVRLGHVSLGYGHRRRFVRRDHRHGGCRLKNV